MKDRIDGWTQQDEDWTFGINGYERCWKGAEPPTLEEQRFILPLYRRVAEAAQEMSAPPPWAHDRDPDTIRAAIDGLLEDVDVPEGLAGIGCRRVLPVG